MLRLLRSLFQIFSKSNKHGNKQSFFARLNNAIFSASETNSKISSARLQSFILVAPILFMVLCFMIIEMWNFIHCMKVDKEYNISNEIIIIFFGICGHHLSILFSRKQTSSISDVQEDIDTVRNGKRKEENPEEN